MVTSYFYASFTFGAGNFYRHFSVIILFMLIFMHESNTRLITHATYCRFEIYIFFFFSFFVFINDRHVIISIKHTYALSWTFSLVVRSRWKLPFARILRWFILFRFYYWNFIRTLINMICIQQKRDTFHTSSWFLKRFFFNWIWSIGDHWVLSF